MAKEFRLSNGVPVLVYPFDGPAAATYWWVRTGSADEGRGEEGFAHFLEHMLFKDAAAKESGRASTGSTARAIEGLGGDINAYTSFDQTVYHVTCAAEHWEQVIEEFAGVAQTQRFLKTDFEREREVILEEYRKNLDSPSRMLFQTLFEQTYRKHPYGRPVIGTERSLKQAKLARLEAFFKRHYRADNMGLIVVGPVSLGESGSGEAGVPIARLLARLERHWGKGRFRAQTGRAPQPKRTPEPAFAPKPRAEVSPFDVQSVSLALSFRVPDLKHDDIPGLDLLASILGQGELSQLYQRLFYDQKLVTEVSSGLYVPLDAGMFYVQAEFEDVAKLEAVYEAILRVLVQACDELVDEDAVTRARTQAESEKLYATQTSDSMAGRIGFLRFVMGDLGHDEHYLRALRGVTRERLRELAREYFDPRRLSVSVLVPKSAPAAGKAAGAALSARLVALGQERLRARAQSTRSKPARVVGPARGLQIEEFERPSGMRVLWHRNAQSPVISVQIAALGGLRLELGQPLPGAPTSSDWGASSLLAMTWTKGAGDLSAQAIARVIEGRAASLEGFSGRNTIGLQMTGLMRDWPELSGLLSQVLVRPTFPAEELGLSRRLAEDSIRTVDDHTSQLCSKLFLESLFDSHPYGKLTHGSLESVAAVTAERLKAYHRAWIQPHRLVVGISGALDRTQIETWVERLEAEFRAVGSTGARAPGALQARGVVLPSPELKAPRWAERKLGREQAHVLIGGRGLTIGDERRWVARVLSNVLGGQGGRLFLELREKKSLAYTVAPTMMEGVEPGYIGTYIACANTKVEEALAGIRKVYEQLERKSISEAELKRARQYLMGRRAMDLQSDSSIASFLALEAVYGSTVLSNAQVEASLARVTSSEVKAFVRNFYLDQPQVSCVVG